MPQYNSLKKGIEEMVKESTKKTPSNRLKEKTDSAKPNKGAIINTVGDTVAESIPNAPKKDNSMPVPRRN